MDEKSLEQECHKAVEHLKREIGRLRTGRASPALLEGVTADYYGSQVPLQQLGSINVPEPRMLTIQVYDSGAISSIEKAIHQADLGINPVVEGTLIRLVMPSLTQERRKELVKKLHKLAEDGKVGLRNHRRDALDFIKKQQKDKVITEDDARKRQEKTQIIIDKYSKEVDSISAAKEKEMMEM